MDEEPSLPLKLDRAKWAHSLSEVNGQIETAHPLQLGPNMDEHLIFFFFAHPKNCPIWEQKLSASTNCTFLQTCEGTQLAQEKIIKHDMRKGIE